MNTLREMLEQRTALKNQLQTIHSAHPDALPEAAQAQWNQLNGELQALEQRIVRQSVLDDAERRIAGQPLTTRTDNRWNELLEGYSLCRALLAHDNSVDCGREREVSAELERRGGRRPRGLLIPDAVFHRPIEQRAELRAQEASVGTAGGFLIPDVLRGDLFIDRLRAASILPRLGVTYLDGLIGSTAIPLLTDSSTIQWVGENVEPTESSLAFGAIVLTPKTAAGQVAYSRRMLLNATPAIEGLVRDDLARQQALAGDTAAVTGSTNAQPQGLLSKGITTPSLGTNGAALTFDALVDLTAQPDEQNALLAGPAWLGNPKTLASLRKLKDSYGRPYFVNLPQDLLGFPLVSSILEPDDGRWSGVDVLSNPATPFRPLRDVRSMFQPLAA